MTQAEEFEACIAGGGVAVFPSDTVYGLACDPLNRAAVERLYGLKARPLDKPSAVMFFELQVAVDAMPELGPGTRAAMDELLPGGVTLLLPNPARRFPLACGEDPAVLGLRVPRVELLSGVPRAVLQTSANLAGGADPRRADDVPEAIRRAVDLVIDGGELPGTASTVVDLRRYEEDGSWRVVRPGAVGETELRHALDWQSFFDPQNYDRAVRVDVARYDRLQDELVAASGVGAARILELGTGTGHTARALLDRHPEARLVGVDSSEQMLAQARRALPPGRVELQVGKIEEGIPAGPFDLVASALCVHHLEAGEKASLFRRVRAELAPGGRFVLADVVVPEDPADARVPLSPGLDKPSSVGDQVAWLSRAGFEVAVAWGEGDLAVVVGRVS